MKLIVGLGNPGTNYARTRHNFGFIVVDSLAGINGARFATKKKFTSTIAETDIGTTPVLLVKPQTFMNNSGEAVRALTQFYKIAPSDIWIVSDDIDLPFGTLRVRHQGSSGGHNGLQSIIDQLGTDAFHRLRIGIGSNRPLRVPAEDYVLQPFSTAEQQSLPEIVESAIKSLSDEIQKNAHTATDEG